MTEPLQPNHLELLKKYAAEVQELETLPPATIELTGTQALALVTHLQIAAANPAVVLNPLLPDAITAAKHIQSSFNPDGAIYKVLELGWDSRERGDAIGNAPSQIFTSTPCRPKKLRQPQRPFFFDEE